MNTVTPQERSSWKGKADNRSGRGLTRFKKWLLFGLLYAVMILIALILFFPGFWMIASSLKTKADLLILPPRWLPSIINWNNYISPWEQLPLARFFLNSTIVTSLAVFGTVFSSAFVAFGFARFSVRGRDFLFIFVLATMMIPDAVTLIPRFILFSRLKWIDTYLPLVLPFYFGSSFFIFLFRQFFTSVPRELDDAARIDGCSYLGVFFRIILPLSKPALFTAAIFSFLWNWNDFLNPLVYLHSLEKFTVAIGLLFFRGQHYSEWGQVMAVSTLMTAPVIVLFLILQRYYVQGIALTGLKG